MRHDDRNGDEALTGAPDASGGAIGPTRDADTTSAEADHADEEEDDDEDEEPEEEDSEIEFAPSERGTIGALLHQMGAASLLTREQELEFGSQLVAARKAVGDILETRSDLLSEALPRAKHFDPGTDFREHATLCILEFAQAKLHASREDAELAQFTDQLAAALDRYRQLRDRFMRSNIRLVISLAKRYRRNGVALADLVQEGLLGLLRAIEKFDPTREAKFSTYAVWWIWQQIGRAGDTQTEMIRTPVQWSQLRRKLGRETVRLEHREGGSVGKALIAEATGIDTERIDAVSTTFQCVSYDAPIGDDDRTLFDTLESGEFDPEREQSHADLAAQINAALGKLSPSDAKLLRLRFGLIDGHSLTLEEVGQQLGMSRERVRQIEARALRMLLPMCQKIGLRQFID